MIFKGNPREMRRFDRLQSNAAAVITTDEATFAGVCQNISAGGAYFRGAVTATVGEVRLIMCLPDLGTVEFEGEIRHADADGCGIAFFPCSTGPNELLEGFLTPH